MAGGGKPKKNPAKPIKVAKTPGQKAILKAGIGGPQLKAGKLPATTKAQNRWKRKK